MPRVPVYLSGGAFGFDPTEVVTESLSVNEVVDIVLSNSDTMMGHPFHLHGHEFFVLGSAGVGEELLLNEDNPVARDTVQVPAMGKAVIRFVANNPGPWIFHCHIDFHLTAGMAMVFLIGDVAEWPAPPPAQPLRLCGGTEDFADMSSNKWSEQFVGWKPSQGASIKLRGAGNGP